MDLSYRHLSSVSNREKLHHPGLLTTQGGLIIIDKIIHDQWTLAESYQYNPQENSTTEISNRAILACLAEAGLLERHDYVLPNFQEQAEAIGDFVSIIIVSFNSRQWLEICLPSLSNQTHTPSEIIVVDNASTDDTVKWMSENYTDIRLLELKHKRSLAYALNQGIAAANGEYYLLLNPDTRLEPDALAHMLAVAKQNPDCAAVAAKLKFLHAPAFLNGIGNYVGPFSWGTDCCLGHLDLGQFDHWDEVPSACFAAALIPANIWNQVGPIDEDFPLYYEDSEWCYRARLLGYSVRAAPRAVVYHAFGGKQLERGEGDLSPVKLRQVVYGRLRFAAKLLGDGYRLRFLMTYFVEDCARFILALLTLRWHTLPAYPIAWFDFLKSLPDLYEERRSLLEQRKTSDKALFELQRKVPVPLVRGGMPLLTWDIVVNHYLPLLATGKTRPVPEFANLSSNEAYRVLAVARRSWWKRALSIWRLEGLSALLHRLGKTISWRLMQV